MTHAILSGETDTVISSLCESMEQVSVGNINVMVDLISRNFEDTDCVGLLKSSKNVTIPPKGVARFSVV